MFIYKFCLSIKIVSQQSWPISNVLLRGRQPHGGNCQSICTNYIYIVFGQVVKKYGSLGKLFELSTYMVNNNVSYFIFNVRSQTFYYQSVFLFQTLADCFLTESLVENVFFRIMSCWKLNCPDWKLKFRRFVLSTVRLSKRTVSLTTYNYF